MASGVGSSMYEKRNLKKSKLGPPDVYPQEKRQKEDELTSVSVKQGFLSNNTIPDEYGTCRTTSISASKVAPYFSSLSQEKQKVNTYQDSAKKKSSTGTKENLIYNIPRNKPLIDQWFKELSSGTKTLFQLSKKIPSFNKKDEIFIHLYEFQVPMLKASWYIKVSAANWATLQAEGPKNKKRQPPDQVQEWTQAFARYLKETYFKLVEFYHGGPNPTSTNLSTFNSSSSGSPLNTSSAANSSGVSSAMSLNTESQKQWQYHTRLTRHIFREGLLDKQEFLSWILDLFERIRSLDDPMNKIVIPLIVQYADDFAESEILTRRLAYHSCKRISQLVVDYTPDENYLRESGENININDHQQITRISFEELQKCAVHRSTILGLSSIVQILVMGCPTALVWHFSGQPEGPVAPFHFGSPLDHLPVPPSRLPMPNRVENELIRQKLYQIEQEIIKRSNSAESRWMLPEHHIAWRQSPEGVTVVRTLQALEALDRQSFDKCDTAHSIDGLYNKIFNPSPTSTSRATQMLLCGYFGQDESSTESDREKSAEKIISNDHPIVMLLCEWAVATKRTGEHRARVVATLLERRQTELASQNVSPDEEPGSSRNQNGMDTDQNSSPLARDPFNRGPIYQATLVDFLDTKAPVLEEKLSVSMPPPPSMTSVDSKQSCSNLILLFSELIRAEVFSHDLYLCTLISRGMFSEPMVTNTTLSNNLQNPGSVKAETKPSKDVSMGTPNAGDGSSHGGSSSLPLFNPNSLSNQHIGPGEEDVDADLDKIVQDITFGQEERGETHDFLGHGADSPSGEDENTRDRSLPGSVPNSVGGPMSNSNTAGATNVSVTSFPAKANPPEESPFKKSERRHSLYVRHFPIPEHEDFMHDINQRHIVIYGFGKERDEVQKAVKKFTKEIQKLFSRKSSMDIQDRGKVKKNFLSEEVNSEAVISKFQTFTYFDQHVITSTCAENVVEMVKGVASGTGNSLPLIESTAFLFDLMEIALNISGLIDFIIQMLKELPEVDQQLKTRLPSLYNQYCTVMGLYAVGVLYRYHCYLLVSPEETSLVFDSLFKLVKGVINPADCSSAERCILWYLCDLYLCCPHLKAKHQESFSPMNNKVRNTIYAPNHPNQSTCNRSKGLMMDYFTNPRRSVDPSHIRQLNDTALFRYSFVCNAIVNICQTMDTEKLNDISVLCAELTARCSSLSAEWLGALKALCCSSNRCLGFSDLIDEVDVNDLSIHDNLGVFTSILIARRCLTLMDFIYHVALHSLVWILPVPGFAQEAVGGEAGARLTCHLLLCLFKTSDSPFSPNRFSFSTTQLYQFASPNPNAFSTPPQQQPSRIPYSIKYPCDRYLLSAAHSSLKVEPVIAVLKGMLMLSDSFAEKDKANESDAKEGTDDEFGMSDILGGNAFVSKMGRVDTHKTSGLSDFAKEALKQICSQQWVHDRCLRDPNHLISKQALLDDVLSPRQAQHLLAIICDPKAADDHCPAKGAQVSELEQKQLISNILNSLDEWTIRLSSLQLQLMHAQCNLTQLQSDMSNFLDNVARATIDFFQAACDEYNRIAITGDPNLPQQPQSSSRPNSSKGSSKSNATKFGPSIYVNALKGNRTWLVSPLISKLPPVVMGKILRVASNELKSGNWMQSGAAAANNAQQAAIQSKDVSKQSPMWSAVRNSIYGLSIDWRKHPTHTSILGFQPYMQLILMCLKCQDEQKDTMLGSLFEQLSQAISDRPNCDDLKVYAVVQEGLELRLGLVGALFDSIQRSLIQGTKISQEQHWPMLMLQLITYGAVDPQGDHRLFTTVLDMLALLIHTTAAVETSNMDSVQTSSSQSSISRDDNNRKQYRNLIKKLEREFQQETIMTPALKIVKHLLPIARHLCEVITCEPMGSLIDTKGNKIQGFDSIDKKQGLQVAEKQKVTPWELIEGQRSCTPLSWTWFSATRMEKKPLKSEETHHLLMRHNHPPKKPVSYYLEEPPRPKELEDEPPQIVSMMEFLTKGALESQIPPPTPTTSSIPQPSLAALLNTTIPVNPPPGPPSTSSSASTPMSVPVTPTQPHVPAQIPPPQAPIATRSPGPMTMSSAMSPSPNVNIGGKVGSLQSPHSMPRPMNPMPIPGHHMPPHTPQAHPSMMVNQPPMNLNQPNSNQMNQQSHPPPPHMIQGLPSQGITTPHGMPPTSVHAGHGVGPPHNNPHMQPPQQIHAPNQMASTLMAPMNPIMGGDRDSSTPGSDIGASPRTGRGAKTKSGQPRRKRQPKNPPSNASTPTPSHTPPTVRHPGPGPQPPPQFDSQPPSSMGNPMGMPGPHMQVPPQGVSGPNQGMQGPSQPGTWYGPNQSMNIAGQVQPQQGHQQPMFFQNSGPQGGSMPMSQGPNIMTGPNQVQMGAPNQNPQMMNRPMGPNMQQGSSMNQMPVQQQQQGPMFFQGNQSMQNNMMMSSQPAMMNNPNQQGHIMSSNMGGRPMGPVHGGQQMMTGPGSTMSGGMGVNSGMGMQPQSGSGPNQQYYQNAPISSNLSGNMGMGQQQPMIQQQQTYFQGPQGPGNRPQMGAPQQQGPPPIPHQQQQQQQPTQPQQQRPLAKQALSTMLRNRNPNQFQPQNQQGQQPQGPQMMGIQRQPQMMQNPQGGQAPMQRPMRPQGPQQGQFQHQQQQQQQQHDVYQWNS